MLLTNTTFGPLTGTCGKSLRPWQKEPHLTDLGLSWSARPWRCFAQLALRAREASSFAVLSKNSESHLILHTFPSAPLVPISAAHTLVTVVDIVYSWTTTQPSLFASNVQEKNAKRTTEQVTVRGQMSWSFGDYELSKTPMLAVKSGHISKLDVLQFLSELRFACSTMVWPTSDCALCRLYWISRCLGRMTKIYNFAAQHVVHHPGYGFGHRRGWHRSVITNSLVLMTHKHFLYCKVYERGCHYRECYGGSHLTW